VVKEPTANDELAQLVDGLELVDHHCHAVVGHDLDRNAFELMLGESGRPAPPGCSTFDTNLGLAVRAWCSSLLDLPAGASAAAYLERRSALGADDVNARMLAGGARELLVDTGYRSRDLASLDQLERWSGGPVHEVVRLEALAETVAASMTRPGGHVTVSIASYADAFADAMAERDPVVGWKSVAAYRGGLGLDWRRPGPAEVRAAAAAWLAAGPVDGPGGSAWRLEDPTLVRHGVWAAIDTGRPVQFHTGFGDADGRLLGSDPALLSDLMAASADIGTPLMLLHCWPHHRGAGHLASLWPHVYLDVGLALPHTGHAAPAVLAQALELAPWHKVLYASDAFGLAEYFHLGAVAHRRALVGALAALDGQGFDSAELARLGTLVASGNARRVYAPLSR